MYRPHEIFARMPAETATQLLGFVHDKEKRLYGVTLETFCKQRKLRPLFIERKPKAQRLAFMRELLGKKVNEAVAAQLLQIWLVAEHKAVLCDFLDALGIAHDENGTIENLPPAPGKEALTTAVDAIFAKHDAGVVLVYLHAFQALDDKGWSTLETMLAEDPRLGLSSNE